MKGPGDFEPLRPADLARGIPDYRQVELQDVRSAGGTSGARVAKQAEGNEWIVKHYSGQTDRVATELLANAIYRELGILVPNAGITGWEIGGRGAVTALAYPMLEGVIRPWREPNEALAEGFVADALLANWDVIGLEQDNILWQGETPIRLDQGGTFEFRAQGKRKPYGPEPVELETMLGPLGQARNAIRVTDEVIQRGATVARTILLPPRISDLIANVPFQDHAMRRRVALNLLARVEDLNRFIPPLTRSSTN